MNRAIAWTAAHPVAANLLMFLILAGGFVGGSTVVQEVFPESDLGAVQVRVAYLGASPEEVAHQIFWRRPVRVRNK